MSTTTIGVLIPYVEGGYFGALLSGIQRCARRHGVTVIAVQTPREGLEHTYAAAEALLAWHHVQGWITTIDIVAAAYLERLRATRRPVVSISAALPDLPCPVVRVDNRNGMRAAVAHLIAHGHRRIAFVGNDQQDDGRERRAGYEAALAEAGIAVDPELIFSSADFIESGGRQVAEELLARGLRCSAIAAITDRIAIGLMERLLEAGVRIPDDVALVGFDDMPLAQYTHVPLTSVRQRFDALGSRAVELLLARLAGAEVPPVVDTVEAALILRRSCGCRDLQQTHQFGPIDTDQVRDPAALATRLTAQALYPERLPPDTAPESVWPGVTRLLEAMQAALDGTPPPPIVDLEQAWREAVRLTHNNTYLLQALLDQLRRAAEARLMAQPSVDPEARTRLNRFIEQMAEAQSRAAQQVLSRWALQLERIIDSNYDINRALVRGTASATSDLNWLYSTNARWGCLALWRDAAPFDQRQLEIVATFGPVPADAHPVGQRWMAEDFPPPALLPPSVQRGEELVMLLPLVTPQRYWGVLGLVYPFNPHYHAGRGELLQWLALLSTAIEREHLLQLQTSQAAELRAALERERALSDTVRELGCPVLPLLPGVLLIPLIGAIDSARAQHLIDTMLTTTAEQHASTVLLDITGVAVVDTQVANVLIQATQAARLLGANVILVGVRPEIAQSIVGLGIDLSNISTAASLSTALASLINHPLVSGNRNGHTYPTPGVRR